LTAIPPTARRPFKTPSALPGFAPTMTVTLVWLAVIVLVPLGALIVKASSLGLGGIVGVALQPRVFASLRVTFGMASAAALVDLVFGALIAWTLTRYDFPGRRLLDAMVDLPFALPTAVAGIALTALYAENGWLGAPLARLGLKVAFTPVGVIVALIFVGLPFVVRTLQPVLEELDREVEQAAATLGATRARIVARIVLPSVWPALLTGFALAFARGIGEYGSVIFIAGNMPMVSEIAPLLIVTRLEQYEYPAATAIAIVMLAISFFVLLGINALQGWSQRRLGPGGA